MQAARKAAKATQKWARQSRSALRTGNPPLRIRLHLIVRNDLHRGPHFAVPEPAIFVAGHQEVPGLLEFVMHLRDVARDDHRVDVGPGYEEAVDHVRRGKTKGDGATPRHCDATR